MALYIMVNEEDCIGCGGCAEMCPTTPCVFEIREHISVVVHGEECEECMLCMENCPTNAITMSHTAPVQNEFETL